MIAMILKDELYKYTKNLICLSLLTTLRALKRQVRIAEIPSQLEGWCPSAVKSGEKEGRGDQVCGCY